MTRTTGKKLLLGVLAVQLIVPAWQIATTDPPRRYAWSMYVESSTVYRYVGSTSDGEQVDLKPNELDSAWKNVHYGRRTLELLCKAHPSVATVTRYYDGQQEAVEQC